jgi:outer membrane receptor protein involved in Fe transport
VNRSNSTSSKAQGVPNEFVIEPGDRIPGIPRNSVRAGLAVDITSRLSLGLNMIAQSSSYVRGNENNDHQPQGTDSDGSAVTARYDPTITTSPGRAYVGDGKIDGFVVFNLSAGYRLSDRWSVFLQVDNLFNEDYVTAGQLGLNSFTTSRWGQRDAAGFNYNSYDWTHSQFVGPGAPRAAWIGISYSSRPN